MLSGFARLRLLAPALRSVRLLSIQPDVEVVVDKSLLSKLRKKTGFPMLKCKKALEQFNNDLKQAEVWMREQAQKEGWEKAGKLQDRPMSHGLVGLIEDGSAVTVVEVNCETDFVARNENFQAFVSQIAEVCHRNLLERDAIKVILEQEELSSLPDDGKTLADTVALQVGNLGENMRLRRAAFVKNDDSTLMTSFVHASGPQITKDRCRLGKFAAIVKMEAPDVEKISKEICQHIIGMNPTAIGEWHPAPIDKKELKKLKKLESEGKTEEKEESRLLDQEFLIEPSFNVRGFLQDNGPKVVDFVRLECGEDLGEDD